MADVTYLLIETDVMDDGFGSTILD